MSTRQGLPTFTLLRLALRVASLGTAIAALVVVARLTAAYGDAEPYFTQSFPGAIAASAIAIFVALFDATAVVYYIRIPKHKQKNSLLFYIFLLDAVVLAVGIYSIFEIALSDWNMADAPMGTPMPWAGVHYTAFVLMIVLSAEAGVGFLLDCCLCRRRREAGKPDFDVSTKAFRPGASRLNNINDNEESKDDATV